MADHRPRPLAPAHNPVRLWIATGFALAAGLAVAGALAGWGLRRLAG
jgi:hypothetical protein